jgi:hypothetical protein
MLTALQYGGFFCRAVTCRAWAFSAELLHALCLLKMVLKIGFFFKTKKA